MKADSETIVITNSSSPLVPLTLVDPNLTNTEDATTILHSTKDTLKIELSARYDELKLSMLGKLLEQNQNISSLSIRKQKEEIIDSKYLTTLRNILINSGIFKKSLQQNSKHLDFSITTLNYHLTVIRDGNELKANITYTKQFVVSMNSEDEKLKKESAQLQKTFMEEHLRLTALESNPLQQDPKEVCKELELKNKKHICQPNYLKKILKKRSIATYRTSKNTVSPLFFCKDNRNIFKDALEKNDIKTLVRCLKNDLKLIDTKLRDGTDALQVAIARKSSKIVRFILTCQPIVNFLHLHHAFDLNNIAIFDQIYNVLLENDIIKSIDHPIPNTMNATFLHIAAAKNLDDFVLYLLGKGANPNIADWDNKTAFFFALENGNIDMMNLLLNVKKLRDEQNVDSHISHTAIMQANATAVRNVLTKIMNPSPNHRKVLRLFLSAQSENFLKSNCFVVPEYKDKKTPLDLITTEDGQPLKTKLDLAIPVFNTINVWSDRDLAIKEEMVAYLKSPGFLTHAQIPRVLVEIISSFLTIQGEYSAKPRTPKFWSNVEQFRSSFDPETITTLFKLHNKNKEKAEQETIKTQHDTNSPSQILAQFVSIIIKEINSLTMPVTHSNIYHVMEKAIRNLYFTLYKDANLFKTEDIRKLIDLAHQFNHELPFHDGELPSSFQTPTTEHELLEKIVCPAIVNSIDDGDLIPVCRALELKTHINLPLLADFNTVDLNEHFILNSQPKQILRQYILTHGDYLAKVQKIAEQSKKKNK